MIRTEEVGAKTAFRSDDFGPHFTKPKNDLLSCNATRYVASILFLYSESSFYPNKAE